MMPAQLALNCQARLDSGTRLDDPRIVTLRELLDQATKLRDAAHELVADLTEQLDRTSRIINVPAQNSTVRPPLISRPR
jgi:hypothetical protein